MSIAGLERDLAGLAAQSAKPSKSLHRKLSAQGNSSMVNLAAIFQAVRDGPHFSLQPNSVAVGTTRSIALIKRRWRK